MQNVLAKQSGNPLDFVEGAGGHAVEALLGHVGLGARLLEAGIEAVGLDTGFYRSGWLYPTNAPRPAVISLTKPADNPVAR